MHPGGDADLATIHIASKVGATSCGLGLLDMICDVDDDDRGQVGECTASVSWWATPHSLSRGRTAETVGLEMLYRSDDAGEPKHDDTQ